LRVQKKFKRESNLDAKKINDLLENKIELSEYIKSCGDVKTDLMENGEAKSFEESSSESEEESVAEVA
jgi:hypothetical protein